MTALLEAQGGGITFDQMLQQAAEDTRIAFDPKDRPTQEVYTSALAQRQQIGAVMERYYAEHRIAALVFPRVRIPLPRIDKKGKFVIGAELVSLGAAVGRNTALGTCANMASLVYLQG